MWRKKEEDIDQIEHFIKDLKTFQKLKGEKWEKIDEEVQMSINPGVPSEDWINPPDENKTLEILQNDADYLNLRNHLLHRIKIMQEIAQFNHFNTHHDFEWINFNTPLIGNAALEDGLCMAEKLLEKTKRKNYLISNIFNYNS